MKQWLKISGAVACGVTLATLLTVVIRQFARIERLNAQVEALQLQVGRAPLLHQRGESADLRKQPEPAHTAQPQLNPTQTLPQAQFRELLRLRGQVAVLKSQLADLLKSSAKDEASQPVGKEEQSNKPSKSSREWVEDAERSAAIAEEKLANAKRVLDVLAIALKVPESAAQVEGTEIFNAFNDPALAPYQVYLRFKLDCFVLANGASAERARADGARAALGASPSDKSSL